MQQKVWFTPEGIEDLLPEEAKKLEYYRRQLLDQFELSGYDLVLPPIAEFTDSLLTGTGRHLAVDTCRFTDQESGHMMGVRADMTPQVARIATNRHKHLKGIQRLCYVGEVLKTRSNKEKGSRSPIQVGAELFGHAGVESDIEVIELALTSLNSVGLQQLTLSLGLVSVVEELMQLANLTQAQQDELVDILLRKAVPEYEAFVSELSLTSSLQTAFESLLSLAGDADAVVPKLSSFQALSDTMSTHLARLMTILDAFKNYTGLTLHVDLADLRGYQYHTGIIFSCYATEHKLFQLAKGGRYDGIGAKFGAEKPATGFSLDLRGCLDLLPAPAEMRKKVVYAPNTQSDDLMTQIESLKAQNTIVKRYYQVEELPAGCEFLNQQDGQWVLTQK